MSQADVDSELERLLAQARAGTQPEPEARARIRAALEPRLAGRPGAVSSRAKLLALLGGAALVAAFAWLSQSRAPTPRAVTTSAPVVAPPPAATIALPAVEPQPSVSVSSLARQKAPPRSVASAPDPAAELELIAAMQSALRAGGSAQALSLAEQHARRFPRGALVQEREGVRAVASCRLADPSLRSGLGAAFLSRYPGSPYAARVRDACR
jgi:hypothetical protein